MAIRFLPRIAWMPLAALVVGCSSPPDAQLVEMARDHAARQTELNRQTIELQKEITEGSRRLVEADAAARSEMVALQHDLQADQQEIGRQRDLLEQERKEIARQRFRDQAVAITFSTIGLLLICGLPLLLCIYVLRAVRTSEAPDAALTEVLINELTADQPRLLTPRRRLPPREEPASPGPQFDEDWDVDEHGGLY